MNALELFRTSVAIAAARHGGVVSIVPLAPAAAILTCRTAYSAPRSIVLFDVRPNGATTDSGAPVNANDVSDRLLLRHRFKRSTPR